MRGQHQCHITDGGVEFVEHGMLFGDAFGIPVERRVVGQVAVLVGLVFGQNLIDDQLRDVYAHECQ